MNYLIGTVRKIRPKNQTMLAESNGISINHPRKAIYRIAHNGKNIIKWLTISNLIFGTELLV